MRARGTGSAGGSKSGLGRIRIGLSMDTLKEERWQRDRDLFVARAWPLIADELKNAVEENSICRGLPTARIIASTLGEHPTLMGAISLVLASKFASALPV